MMVALVIWMMSKFGVQVPPERFAELDAEFYARPALVNVHFGRQFRPHDDDRSVFGFGYERHLGEQRYVGVGLLADVLVRKRHFGESPPGFMLAAQVFVHPIKPLELTYAIGPIWEDNERKLVNRFALGYRVSTMHFAPVPSLAVDVVDLQMRWTLGCQLEF
jgi:hypothetical protein